jgi:hypothetical protein
MFGSAIHAAPAPTTLRNFCRVNVLLKVLFVAQ